MAQKDYYKTLGISKDASQDDIKKAYRKLAMKHHPDHAKGKANEDKFKEISEAYAVLSDPEKKQQYDTFGSEGFQQRFSQEDIFRGSNIEDILREFGFGGGSIFTNFSRGKKGGTRGARFSFDPESMFGFGGGGQHQTAQMKGTDVEYELPLTLHEIVAGTSKTLTLQMPSGSSDTLTVQIPKGMIAGKKLRIAGRGQSSPYGGTPGDLYIKSKMIHDPVFKVENHDLTINRSIKLTEALLGTQISVPTLDGKQLSLKIPPGTKHKNKMRLAGHGIPHMKGGGAGDLFVEVLVQMPARLSDKQKQLIEKLAETGI
ncbi:MAG: DnaJ domain-containing protein [Desulfobacterales bacterium]|jgi:curved DNA-binding protein|nr:DnaJ domain-containing protein [Desulfobacterales bacterium]